MDAKRRGGDVFSPFFFGPTGPQCCLTTGARPDPFYCEQPMYLDYYHLSQKPFQINTDPSFLWLGEKHQEALATFKYGLQENKGFLLLTGDVGVGKTTVINAMLRLMGDDDLAVSVHDPSFEPLDFFNFLARSFGLPGDYTSKGAFVSDFKEFLLQNYYRGRRVLLIVDESQLLSSELLEEIRLLSNLEKDGVKLINIFFVGQLEFNDILLRPENRAIRQRITVNYNIPPLSEQQTGDYIEYRLAVAGVYKRLFDKAAIREVHRFSNGYPRLINIIADRALLTGYTRDAKKIDRSIVRECAEELDISNNLLSASQHAPNGSNPGTPETKTPSRLIYLLFPPLVILLVLLMFYFSDTLLPLLPLP